MIFLHRFELLWLQSATIFILISLCAAQTTADITATRRWNAYVADLQSRLVNGRGVIPWEATLLTANQRADIDWQLLEIGWVIPYICIVYAPGGIVNAMRLRGVDYGPYERFLATQQSRSPAIVDW